MKHTFKYTSRNSGGSGGAGFLSLLATVFITLKLTHQIAWSWVWVLAPIWMPMVLVVLVVVGIFAFEYVKEAKRFENFRRWGTRTRLKWRKAFCKHDYKKSRFQALNTETQTYVCTKCDKQIEG